MIDSLRQWLVQLQPPVALEGTVGGCTWRIASGTPTRDYIRGRELRGKADLGLDPGISVLVISRALKASLERSIYDRYIDAEQTMADLRMPEEVRWLSTFEDVRAPEFERDFLRRYAVLADMRNHAVAWVRPVLQRLLLEWPAPGPSDQLPFMLMLLRGHCYLRMQHEPASARVTRHASELFACACEAALTALASPPVPQAPRVTGGSVPRP